MTFTAVRKVWTLLKCGQRTDFVLPRVTAANIVSPVAKTQGCLLTSICTSLQSQQGLSGSPAPPPDPLRRCPSGARCGLASPGHQQYNETENPHGPQSLQQSHAVFGDDHLGQVVGDEGNLMSHTNKDEGANQNVEGGVSWDEDQNPLGVSCKPYVVLANEKLWDTKSMVLKNTSHKTLVFCDWRFI